MYAWQRRSKKPLAPQKPTDFDDVLKLTDGAKKLVLTTEEEEEEEKENALPSSKNASFEEKDLAEGEEKERDEEDGCESWERMRTKAMEAFVKLEFKRAARWFGKALEKLQIEEEEEESREKRNRASLLANLSLALLRGNEKKEALEAAIACEEEDAQWHKGSYRKAETLYALGEFKEAAEAYESAKAKILDYKTEEKNVDAAINELDGKIHASKEKMEELEELKSIDEEANEWKKRVQGDQNQTEEEKSKAVDQAQLDAEERERERSESEKVSRTGDGTDDAERVGR